MESHSVALAPSSSAPAPDSQPAPLLAPQEQQPPVPEALSAKAKARASLIRDVATPVAPAYTKMEEDRAPSLLQAGMHLFGAISMKKDLLNFLIQIHDDQTLIEAILILSGEQIPAEKAAALQLKLTAFQEQLRTAKDSAEVKADNETLLARINDLVTRERISDGTLKRFISVLKLCLDEKTSTSDLRAQIETAAFPNTYEGTLNKAFAKILVSLTQHQAQLDLEKQAALTLTAEQTAASLQQQLAAKTLQADAAAENERKRSEAEQKRDTAQSLADEQKATIERMQRELQEIKQKAADEEKAKNTALQQLSEAKATIAEQEATHAHDAEQLSATQSQLLAAEEDNQRLNRLLVAQKEAKTQPGILQRMHQAQARLEQQLQEVREQKAALEKSLAQERQLRVTEAAAARVSLSAAQNETLQAQTALALAAAQLRTLTRKHALLTRRLEQLNPLAPRPSPQRDDAISGEKDQHIPTNVSTSSAAAVSTKSNALTRRLRLLAAAPPAPTTEALSTGDGQPKPKPSNTKQPM